MENATNFLIVYITNPSFNDSREIAKILVNENLAACCSIIPKCISFFKWENEIQEREEFILMIKTKESKLELLEKRILELHPDEVPEIIAVPIVSGLKSYLGWINDCVGE